MRKNILRDCVLKSKKNISNHPQFKNSKSNYIHYTYIIQDNKIIEQGANVSARPPKHFGYPEWSKIHAEVTAWKKSKGLLDKSKTFEAVNVRLNRLGTIKNSKPCNCCSKFLKELGCNKIWFTTDVGFAMLYLF